ncbi:MAG TPA: hypothetical protein PLC09_06090 [Holophaga sp.]|nr:hypothetical protein [Holophaga sp.]
MRLRTLFLIPALLLAGAPAAQAGELPPDITAKLLKILVTNAGGKISCRDAALKDALTAVGVTVEDSAKVVWVTNPAQAKMLKSQGKLVVGPSPSLLYAGAGVALVEDGGKPKILLQMANVSASGVTLPDALLKVGAAQ